jgi:hypothetical protein
MGQDQRPNHGHMGLTGGRAPSLLRPQGAEGWEWNARKPVS